jgi:hypothetical protein
MRHSGHAACGTNGGHLLFGRLLVESAQRLRRLGQALLEGTCGGYPNSLWIFDQSTL